MKTIAQILTKNDSILSIEFNFDEYKKNTFFNNKEDELKVRYKNLHDIINTFNKYNILYWLQGKTILGIYKYKKLIENDSDEDIGTDSCNILFICEKIIPELLKLNFKVIRATKNNSMVSLMRDNRYLDICFFREKKEIYYYEKKKFPKKFYEKFINISVDNFVYSIPKNSNEICKYSYNL